MIKVTFVDLVMTYDAPVQGFGCFGPLNQAVGEPATTNPGGVIVENVSFSNSITNMTCQIKSLNLTTIGFHLSSILPVLPVNVKTGQTVYLMLTITSPTTAFEGPLKVEMHLSAQNV